MRVVVLALSVLLALALFAISRSAASQDQQPPSGELVIVETADEGSSVDIANAGVAVPPPSVPDFVATHDWQEVLEGREFPRVLLEPPLPTVG